ncbi:premelanosome protein S homeolog precursor [Xenopus laevis]|uniref:Premelanosome protein S homeolog precursor n=1 Tax=Xenopus laevis TaxID=8355 RepID=E7FIE3_XENLA|nr:premelanosome protein S homeolog precursor [Xenopus laevis]BAJ72733.1 silver protein [Xenopus laevis]
MKGVFCLVVLWVFCVGGETQNWSQNRVQQTNQQVAGNRQSPFKSWNSRMYPIWRGSEAQKKNCWKGGQVTFDLVNDAPTLTGAKATFSIRLNFPNNQTVLPDGQVVWGQNRTDNGTWIPSEEPIYPDESTEGSECTFPDGRPFPRGVEKKHSKFVYVWQTWGKYWQVVDGPSSNLTVETDGIPLGSYTMQVVVYHYRGRQKFIPIGSISSQFTITDQIPVSVSISQLLDLDQEDQRFIQNRAVSFAVAIHDPSHYLQAADISFSWDFGDQSGTLITRNTDVTHTYVSPGVFRPKVVLQAAIPIAPCGSTAPVATAEPVPTTVAPAQPTTAAASTSGGQVTDAPPGTTAALPGNITEPQGTINGIVVTIPSDEQNNLAAEATLSSDNEAATLPEAIEDEAGVTVAGEETVPEEEEAVPNQEQAVTVAEAVPNQEQAVTVPNQEQAVTVAEAVPSQEAEAVTSEAETTEAIAELAEGSPSVPSQINELPGTTAEVLTVPATEAAEEVVVIAKRQAPEDPLVGCLLYRYGTFATDLDIVQGIESAQIVQVAPVAAVDGAENAVDLTITCQGSVPSQVCTIISNPDCTIPQETVCNTVQPSTDCQLVLRQVFNETGLYCVNVSLTDSVSLAMASTQVSVSGAGSSFSNGGIVIVGVLLAVFAVVIVAYTYRQKKSYTALTTAPSPSNWFPDRLSLRLFFQNALGLSRSGENSPLLNGRVV